MTPVLLTAPDSRAFGVGIRTALGPVSLQRFRWSGRRKFPPPTMPAAFGVDVSTKLSLFSVSAYGRFDNSVKGALADANGQVGSDTTAGRAAMPFGVNVGATLGPITLSAFTDQVSMNGVMVYSAKFFKATT